MQQQKEVCAAPVLCLPEAWLGERKGLSWRLRPFGRGHVPSPSPLPNTDANVMSIPVTHFVRLCSRRSLPQRPGRAFHGVSAACRVCSLTCGPQTLTRFSLWNRLTFFPAASAAVGPGRRTSSPRVPSLSVRSGPSFPFAAVFLFCSSGSAPRRLCAVASLVSCVAVGRVAGRARTPTRGRLGPGLTSAPLVCGGAGSTQPTPRAGIAPVRRRVVCRGYGVGAHTDMHGHKNIARPSRACGPRRLSPTGLRVDVKRDAVEKRRTAFELLWDLHRKDPQPPAALSTCVHRAPAWQHAFALHVMCACPLGGTRDVRRKHGK